MLKRQVRDEIDGAFQGLRMNLENNYKDLAKNSLQEVEKLIVKHHESGTLKGRAYEKYYQKLEEYRRGMIGYHH